MKRQWVVAACVSLIGLPLCIFTHELGHFAVAKLYGWPTELHPAKVVYFSNPAVLPRILFLAAGPMVDLLQLASGVATLRWLHRSKHAPSGLIYWMGLVLSFVSVKWLITPFFAYFIPMNDERQISSLLGLPSMLLPCAVAVPGAIAMFFLIRQHRKHHPLASLTIVPLAGILGAGVWINLIGPLLLKHS